MGRASRAQNVGGQEQQTPSEAADVDPLQIPLDALKQIPPLERISLVEGLNYVRAHAGQRPVVEEVAEQPESQAPAAGEGV